MSDEYIIWFENLGMNDIEQVGGKNASLGEMIQSLTQSGVKVPNGFASTSYAFQQFLKQDGLDQRISEILSTLDTNDLASLTNTGKTIRQWIIDTPFPDAFDTAIRQAYKTLITKAGHEIAVAVRSSATAEDLPDASFAGQQETYLNIRGIDAVLVSIKQVFASLYNDRAISYRVHQNFDHNKVALSAGIQHMVRSDIGASGVAFTLDTESGFRDAVFITGAYGLGETVVQGAVNPDEFYVYKPNIEKQRPAILRRTRGEKAIKMIFNESPKSTDPVKTVDVDKDQRRLFCINNTQIEELARIAITIENHYGRPMDIEWALDGEDNQLYIVQARPETVESRNNGNILERYELQEAGTEVCTGRAIGQRIGQGPAKVIDSIKDMHLIIPGDVLVTDMTDPDWEPIMKKASAIVTNRGGRTCHAAIIARELGIPAVVGCGNATDTIKDQQTVTVSCAEGDTGKVYDGLLKINVSRTNNTSMPNVPTKIMMNVGNPERAFQFSSMPNDGVGLARLEFVINNTIGIHPKALLEYDQLDNLLKTPIAEITAAYSDPVSFYVDKLIEGIATLAAAFYPKKVIVRMSDFKSNEYANLLAGDLYEPNEENPMIGFRGAARYVSDSFRPCFELECKALKYVRDEMEFTNVEIMIPFVRTVKQAEKVITLLEENGLKRGENGLRVIMMCEVPSNVVLADEYLEIFDGFSIGSNDLTQLMLGLDRDSGLVAELFDERDPAVKKMLQTAIQAAIAKGKYVGICGQGPSDYPELAQWLVNENISSLSLNPDTVVKTWLDIAEKCQHG